MPAEAQKRSRSPELAQQKSNKRPHNNSSTSFTRPDAESAMAPSNDEPSITTAGGAGAGSSSQPETLATTAVGSGGDDSQQSPTTDSNSAAPSTVAAQNIHMRCLIVTSDASVIIGRNGSHVNEIRDKSGARIMVSESIPGNPERILNVNGALDAVSKVHISPLSPG